ncbi:MAG: ROK family glucokinase [Fusobacteriaceae bacterium]|jgi:glucokinase|nr:ROK family glucokinase [Fusobacteriaceae bacterium]
MNEVKYKIGIDIGGTNIKMGVVNDKNEIIAKKSIKTDVKLGYIKIIKNMANAIKELLYLHKIDLNNCISIGIGCPGTVNFKTGEILFAANLLWEGVPLAEELKKNIDLPIKVSNDANCAALGEAIAGGAKGVHNMVLITLGTGVGGGVIIDGKIYEGGSPGGVELGHTVLVVDGEQCTCGRKGCFEAYASATALIRDTKRAAEKNPNSLINELCSKNLSKINGLTPFEAARLGDEEGIAIIDRYIMHLAEGIIDIVNIFRPEKILLSGGIANQGDALIEPLKKYVKKYTFAGDKIHVADIKQATLGNDAGIIGAANL